MKQLFHHYTHWEDYQSGMYRKASASEEEYLIAKAVDILRTPQCCYDAMKAVAREWKLSCEEQFTNKAQNRLAWLGWAACSYAANVPYKMTCQAWKRLSDQERAIANALASTVITLWESTTLCQNAQLDFPF